MANYLGGLIRTGLEFRLAKHFSTTLAIGYRPEASFFLNSCLL
jgi:hypothetical protein